MVSEARPDSGSGCIDPSCGGNREFVACFAMTIPRVRTGPGSSRSTFTFIIIRLIGLMGGMLENLAMGGTVLAMGRTLPIEFYYG